MPAYNISKTLELVAYYDADYGSPTIRELFTASLCSGIKPFMLDKNTPAFDYNELLETFWIHMVYPVSDSSLQIHISSILDSLFYAHYISGSQDQDGNLDIDSCDLLEVGEVVAELLIEFCACNEPYVVQSTDHHQWFNH